MRRMLAIAAAALLSGVVVAGALVVPATPDQLVEGHTVFVSIESFENETGQATFAAAVAVLIREAKDARTGSRFPGVLWFNDQYLVDPTDTRTGATEFRHPCTGAVLAVPHGSVDPRPTFDALNAPDLNPLFTPPVPTYVESYLITDPSDHVWIVDLWNVADPVSMSNATVPVWSVPILGSRLTQSVPDDGSDCPPLRTRECVTPFLFSDDRDCLDQACGDDVFILDRTDCLVESATSPDFFYNAMLFVPLDILLAWKDGAALSGVKDHVRGSADYLRDIAGCQADTLDYPCPDNDDNAEGNSHPFNPELFLFRDSDGNAVDQFFYEAESAENSTLGGQHGGVRYIRSALSVQTETVHGASANCDDDPAVDIDCHATFLLDLFYWVTREPVTRNFREEYIDLIGSAAPYECEQPGGCENGP